MNNTFYSILFLPILIYSGGDIQPIDINMDNVIENNDMVNVVIGKPEKLNILSNDKIGGKVEQLSVNSTNYYIGVSVAQASFDGETNGNVLKNGHPIGLMAKVGYDMSTYIGLEARVGLGIKKDTIAQAENKWENLWGAYLKPKVKLSKKIEAFGLVGYGAAKQKINNSSISNNGFSYGAGASYDVNQDWSVVVDAVRYATEDNHDVDAYALGLEYRF